MGVNIVASFLHSIDQTGSDISDLNGRDFFLFFAV